jgi:hypothetical protein
VLVKGQGTVFMKDLQLGDEVLVDSGNFETVYSFGHRDDTVLASFLLFLPSKIEISMDHMLKIKGRHIPASAVQVGDELEMASGEFLSIDEIQTVIRHGAYAPFTKSGTIVVSNIKASNYIAFQGSGHLVLGGWKTLFSYQWLAHVSQAPHRICVQLFGLGNETYSDRGLSRWIDVPHQLGDWFVQQNSGIMMLVLVPVLLCLVVVSAIEVLLSWGSSY